MSSHFGFIDIILLAMFAGFIILRLRNILGRRTGHEKNLDAKFWIQKSILKKYLKKINNRVKLSKNTL